MRKIGRYEVVRVVLSRRSAALFDAFEPGTERRVTLLRSSFHGTGAAELVPFLDGEPQALALRHPRIARVLSLGVDDGAPYVVLDPVSGTDLGSLIRSGPPCPFEWKLRVLDQVCDGIAYAHAQGVLHLDVRPANVFATSQGVVTIVGFGLAPLHAAALQNPSAPPEELYYAAPEQLADTAVDPRTDVYGIGALAYALFAGRPPVSGQTVDEVRTRIAAERTIGGRLPGSARFKAVVLKALARSLSERFQSVEGLRRELSELARDTADLFLDDVLGTPRAVSSAKRVRTPGAAAAPVGPGAPRDADRRGGVDRVHDLFSTAMTHAAQGQLEEASKLARAIRVLAPGDPRNQELTSYLLSEAEADVEEALAGSASGPRAVALRLSVERLFVVRQDAGLGSPPYDRRWAAVYEAMVREKTASHG